MSNSRKVDQQLLRLLSAVARLTTRDGIAPSFRDLAAETGSSVSMVSVRIRQLQKLGLISVRARTARSIRITGHGVGTLEVA